MDALEMQAALASQPNHARAGLALLTLDVEMTGPVANNMRNQSRAALMQRRIIYNAVTDSGRIQVVECRRQGWQAGFGA